MNSYSARPAHPAYYKRHMSAVFLILLLAMPLFTSGCYELRRFREMDVQVAAMSKQLNVLDAKVTEMDEKLSSLSDISRRNMAGQGANLTDIRLELQEVKGLIDELNYELGKMSGTGEGKSIRERQDILEKKVLALQHAMGLTDLPVHDPKPRPNDKKPPPLEGPERDYRTAKDLMDAGDYEEARALFKRFIEQHPTSKLVDDAQFSSAECYYKAKKYEEAILEYNKVIKQYSKGNKLPESYLKIGYCFANLDKKKEASLFLKEVIRRFPDSKEAKLAKRKLDKIR